MKSQNKFIPKDGRKIAYDILVGVHWNSHKNCWSIVKMNSRHSTGLVLGYCDEITLRDVTTHIDKAKQRKVINSPTKAKDRHAFLVGYIESLDFEKLDKDIYYSPHHVKDFVDAEKWFQHEEKRFIENVNRASLTWNYNADRPLVKYNQ